MDKKIKISHSEVELKFFLEAIAVIGIFILLFAGYNTVENLITGFFTVSKMLNYSDEVMLSYNESTKYIWTPSMSGELKSLKLDGEIIGNGSVRVYLNQSGVIKLIFDSNLLAKQESGFYGITGFTVQDDDASNIAPSWISNLSSINLSDNATIDLSQHFYDPDNDTLIFSSNNISEIEAVITDNTLKLIPPANTSILVDFVLSAYDGANITFRTLTLNVDTLLKNESLDLNDTNITKPRTITSKLSYGDDPLYDPDNNGKESKNKVIDFSVSQSTFNWDVSEDKLCTRYEIYSLENQESTFTCYGDDGCCSLVNLKNSRDNWNDPLYLSYGAYGSTERNIIFSQILYSDINLTGGLPVGDATYSQWSNKTADFVEGIIEFSDTCVDTCIFSGNESSYTLVIEIENATLNIGKIKYQVESKIFNEPPLLSNDIPDLEWAKNTEFIFDLSSYFNDPDNDTLTYSGQGFENFNLEIDGEIATIKPNDGYTGISTVSITASDSYSELSSNEFRIDIKNRSITIIDKTISDSILNISFRAYGKGNLTIGLVNGSYAEMYLDNLSTEDNLEIIKLTCGDYEYLDTLNLIEFDKLGFSLANGTSSKMSELLHDSATFHNISIRDFECNQNAYLLAKVLIDQNNLQFFNFDNETVYSDKLDKAEEHEFKILDKLNNTLAIFDSFGNLKIKGNTTLSLEFPDTDDFAILSPNGSYIITVTNPEGDLATNGTVYENEKFLNPPANSFIIQDNRGLTVAYSDSSGNLFLKGTLSRNINFTESKV
jgi:hypothetical protein